MNDLKAYNEVKHLIQTGDAIEWRGRGPVSRLIKWKTGSSCTHIGLAHCLTEVEGPNKRRFTSEALGRGVYPNLLGKRLARYHGEAWLHPLKDEFNLLRVRVSEEAAEYWGDGYDFLDLCRQLTSRVSTDIGALFCSELVYICYRKAGILYPDRPFVQKEEIAPYPGEVIKLGIFKEPVRLI